MSTFEPHIDYIFQAQKHWIPFINAKHLLRV
jgi:hypothetical protein